MTLPPRGRPAFRRRTLPLLLLSALALQFCLAQPASTGPGDRSAGERLFTGQRPFQNGGPACATCHSIAGIPFPNGGNMGPDLTKTYSKFGPEGADAMLQTLFFPTMMPLFQDRSLTAAEQADLKAFLAGAAALPPPPDYTLEFGVIALCGLLALLLASGIIWRKRLRGVRATLVKTAAGGRA